MPSTSGPTPLPGAGRNMGSRGSTMAVACGTAIAVVLGGMYVMNRDVKQNEGKATVLTNQGKGIKGTDSAMTSSDVSDAVTNGIKR